MAHTWEDAKDALVRTYKYPGATFHKALFSDAFLVTTAFTATPATDVIAPASGNLIAGCRVRLSTTGTLPPPLAESTDYYIVGATGSLKLALNFNGTAIDITGAGTGTHTITEQEPNKYATLAVWGRFEIDYKGSGRQAASWANASVQEDFVNQRVYLDGQFFSFNPVNADMTYRWSGLIVDGNGTRSDTTGRIRDVKDFFSLQTQVKGNPLELVFKPSIQITTW